MPFPSPTLSPPAAQRENYRSRTHIFACFRKKRIEVLFTPFRYVNGIDWRNSPRISPTFALSTSAPTAVYSSAYDERLPHTLQHHFFQVQGQAFTHTVQFFLFGQLAEDSFQFVCLRTV